VSYLEECIKSQKATKLQSFAFHRVRQQRWLAVIVPLLLVPRYGDRIALAEAMNQQLAYSLYLSLALSLSLGTEGFVS
jgi:hypothetical protein